MKTIEMSTENKRCRHFVFIPGESQKGIVRTNEMGFKNESKTQRQVSLKGSLKISHYNTRTHTAVVISTKVCSIIKRSKEYCIVVDLKKT